jgi:hypothetical protein
MDVIVECWESVTGFETEAVEYRSIYLRDVNSYLAFKKDGKVKQKGAFAFTGTKGMESEKSPANYVCIDAVIAYLRDGVPLESTVRSCTDIRRFLTLRQVSGGAVWKRKYLGKVVRWYYGIGETESIHYVTNNNRVGRSEGAYPCQVLPADIPANLDYDWYIREAVGLLDDLGVEHDYAAQKELLCA